MATIATDRPADQAVEQERTMREIDAALSLLRRGIARRVYLCGFHLPRELTVIAETRAQANGITIHVDMVDGCPALVLGARDGTGSSPSRAWGRE